jgi:hypothetical protein
MSSRVRDRVLATIAATLLLGLAAACSTAVQPAASPQGATASAEQERCDRSGGVWRNGVCQTSANGGGY